MRGTQALGDALARRQRRDRAGRGPSRAARSRRAVDRAAPLRETATPSSRRLRRTRDDKPRSCSRSSSTSSFKPAVVDGHAQNLGVARRRRSRALPRARRASARRRRVNTRRRASSLRRRIEHDADGVRALDVPHRELRIVARDGAGADDDRGRQRAQPVQMPHVVRARHVVRIARRRRDVAVEALSQVRNRERPPGTRDAQRRIELEQWPHGCRRVGRARRKLVAAADEPVGVSSARYRAGRPWKRQAASAKRGPRAQPESVVCEVFDGCSH